MYFNWSIKIRVSDFGLCTCKQSSVLLTWLTARNPELKHCTFCNMVFDYALSPVILIILLLSTRKECIRKFLTHFNSTIFILSMEIESNTQGLGRENLHAYKNTIKNQLKIVTKSLQIYCKELLQMNRTFYICILPSG